jgi:alpha-mannosidase
MGFISNSEPSAARKVIHLIPNAHLDPVWLWRVDEGLQAGIATVRSVVSLMREFPRLTFIRGESLIYETTQRYDPETFQAIRAFVEDGRWEIVGGNVVQPDMNLPGTAAMRKQFEMGKRYFRETFGVDVKVAWAADAFGHSGGMPDLLSEAGFDCFACTRPFQGQLPLDRPAFWWRGLGGATLLSYRPRDCGWYGCERDEMPKRLDAVLNEASDCAMDNVACLFGLGNHGGGPTRWHLRDIDAWAAAHPEVEVRYSTLSQLFAALREEVASKGDAFLPYHTGELGFCLRGTYASDAQLKFAFRRAQADVQRTDALQQLTPGQQSHTTPLWRELLINSFHDILPGTLVRSAHDEQMNAIAAVSHQAREIDRDRLFRLATEVISQADHWPAPQDVDSPAAVPVLVVNPHPFEVRSLVDAEVCLDDRPIFSIKSDPQRPPVRVRDSVGRQIAAQTMAHEHDFLPKYAWRARALFPVTLGPRSSALFHLDLDPSPTPLPEPSRRYVVHCKTGDSHIRVTRDGANWLGEGLRLAMYRDDSGSWGDFKDAARSCPLATASQLFIVEEIHERPGPLCDETLVSLRAGRSTARIRFTLDHAIDHLRASVELFSAEPHARVRLELPASDNADYEVPGGVQPRSPAGDVPGLRWVRTRDWTLLTDALHCFEQIDGHLAATVCRTVPFATERDDASPGMPEAPLMDMGLHRFNFVVTPERRVEAIDPLATLLDQPVYVLPIARPALTDSGNTTPS